MDAFEKKNEKFLNADSGTEQGWKDDWLSYYKNRDNWGISDYQLAIQQTKKAIDDNSIDYNSLQKAGISDALDVFNKEMADKFPSGGGQTGGGTDGTPVKKSGNTTATTGMSNGMKLLIFGGIGIAVIIGIVYAVKKK